MSRKDVVLREYMSDRERFADVFNYYLYNGKPIINPEMLEERNPAELIAFLSKGNLITKDKYRDLLKECVLKDDGHNYLLILGIENQSYIDYAMPIRNLTYDAMNYSKQLSDKRKEHHRLKDLKGDEFLSGFSKDDKIKPVITLVIYFGTEEWDGPRTLYDMFDVQDENILKYVSNYKINLIVPKEISDEELFSTDLRKVMKVLKKADDKNELKKLLENQKERDELLNLPSDTMMVIKQYTGINIELNEEGENDMCKGMEELLKDAREEGREEGRKAMCKGMEELLKDAREEGREEGREDERYKIILKFYYMGKISKAETMEELQISEEEFEQMTNNTSKE